MFNMLRILILNKQGTNTKCQTLRITPDPLCFKWRQKSLDVFDSVSVKGFVSCRWKIGTFPKLGLILWLGLNEPDEGGGGLHLKRLHLCLLVDINNCTVVDIVLFGRPYYLALIVQECIGEESLKLCLWPLYVMPIPVVLGVMLVAQTWTVAALIKSAVNAYNRRSGPPSWPLEFLLSEFICRNSEMTK